MTKLPKLAKPEEVVSRNNYINILVYGMPGAGKTTFAASTCGHPDMSPVLFLNFEGGLISIPQELRSNAEKIDIDSVSKLESVFWALVNKTDGYDQFKTIVVDSGSEMQTLHLEELGLAAFEANKTEDRDELRLKDYGKDTARLKRIFRWFRDSPMHVVITALVKRKYKRVPNKEPKLIEAVPAFTDRLGESLRGYCDYVWYLYKDDEERRHLLTADQGGFRAKTRGANFAKEIGKCVDDPDIPTLYNTLLSSEGLIKGDKK